MCPFCPYFGNHWKFLDQYWFTYISSDVCLRHWIFVPFLLSLHAIGISVRYENDTYEIVHCPVLQDSVYSSLPVFYSSPLKIGLRKLVCATYFFNWLDQNVFKLHTYCVDNNQLQPRPLKSLFQVGGLWELPESDRLYPKCRYIILVSQRLLIGI